MNGDKTERISQESECRNEEEYGILERASAFAHRILEEIEALTGTTACKSVQLVRLEKWAQEQIFDAVEGNVLMGDDGHIYFIDTIIYPSDTGGYETYCSLSPRASSKRNNQ